MKFTGEQILLGQVSKRVENDHLARYCFAKNFVKNKIVLDIACGSGYGSKMLSDCGARKVYGVDLSNEAINYAKEHFSDSKIKYICGNAENLNYFDNCFFDVIITFETIEHLENKIRDRYLRELYRVLKDDGILILSTPNRRVVSPNSKKPLYPFHVHEYNFRELKKILEENNFKIDFYGQRIIFKFYNIGFVRRLAQFIEKNIMKRRIDKYWIPTPPEVVKFDFWHEPRTFVVIGKKILYDF